MIMVEKKMQNQRLSEEIATAKMEQGKEEYHIKNRETRLKRF
jgi:hypothetical protein